MTILDLFADIAPPEAAKYCAGHDYQNPFWATQRRHLIGTDESGIELLAAYTGQHWVGGFRYFKLDGRKLQFCFELMPGEVKIFSQRGWLTWPDDAIVGGNLNYAYAAAASAVQALICSSGTHLPVDSELLMQVVNFCREQRLQA